MIFFSYYSLWANILRWLKSLPSSFCVCVCVCVSSVIIKGQTNHWWFRDSYLYIDLRAGGLHHPRYIHTGNHTLKLSRALYINTKKLLSQRTLLIKYWPVIRARFLQSLYYSVVGLAERCNQWSLGSLGYERLCFCGCRSWTSPLVSRSHLRTNGAGLSVRLEINSLFRFGWWGPQWSRLCLFLSSYSWRLKSPRE